MEPTKEPVRNTPEVTRSRDAFYLILIGILLIGCGVLGWQLSNKMTDNNTYRVEVAKQDASIKELEELLGAESDGLKESLLDMMEEYDNLTTENQGMNDSIDSQKQKIADLLEQVRLESQKNNKNVRRIAKYKKEAETLRKIMKGYVHTIDSLNTMIIERDSTIRLVTGERNQFRDERDKVKDENDDLTKTVEKGSKLQALNVETYAIRVNRGRESETNRASRADQIKACFTIAENTIAKKGEKDIYMRVISPEGKVLSDGEGDEFMFKFKGVKGYFSDKRAINYENQALDLCVFYRLKTDALKGEYTVELYCERAKIGSGKFTLK
jgi:hypothetical protein